MLFGVTTGVSRRGSLQQESLRAGLQRIQGLLHLILVPTLLLSLGPLVLLLIDAGKTAEQFEAHPWTLTLPYHFKNYWVMAGGMSRYILNSSIISGIAIPLALALASYTSYVFARFSFPGKESLFYAIIMLMMIPFVLYLVPQYLLVLSLGLMKHPLGADLSLCGWRRCLRRLSHPPLHGRPARGAVRGRALSTAPAIGRCSTRSRCLYAGPLWRR